MSRKLYGGTRYGSTYSGLIAVDVRGVESVVDSLELFTDKSAKGMLQKSATAGAKVLRDAVKAKAPVGKTGALKRSVRSGQTKRKRPAARVWLQKDINFTRGPNTTFYRHMVVGGTKAHGPRTKPFLAWEGPGGKWIRASKVRGVAARPFVAEGFAAGQAAAMQAIDAAVDKALKAI